MVMDLHYQPNHRQEGKDSVMFVRSTMVKPPKIRKAKYESLLRYLETFDNSDC